MLLKNSKGYSMLELTISLGLLGLIVAGAMFLVSSSLKNESSLNLDDDVDEITNFIQLTTSKVGACGLKIDTLLTINQFRNNNIPNAPTESFNIPVDLYLVSDSKEPITNKTSLKARYANNKNVRIKNIELILPEVVDSLPDGERATRATVVAHLEKKVGGGNFESFPPLKIDTIVNILVEGANVTLQDCGNSWDLFALDTPLTEQDQRSGSLTNDAIELKPLGRHSVCVLSERALKTGESKTGFILINRSYKPIAQRANFKCRVMGPNESGEWFLEVESKKEKGRGGTYACSAFCI
jgi:hypothetical protein